MVVSCFFGTIIFMSYQTNILSQHLQAYETILKNKKIQFHALENFKNFLQSSDQDQFVFDHYFVSADCDLLSTSLKKLKLREHVFFYKEPIYLSTHQKKIQVEGHFIVTHQKQINAFLAFIENNQQGVFLEDFKVVFNDPKGNLAIAGKCQVFYTLNWVYADFSLVE